VTGVQTCALPICKSPLYFQKHGVALLPGSRLEEGLISGLDLVHHALLNRRPRSFFLRRNDARNSVRTAINTFKISAVPDSPVETLSGGNQQRFLLSLLPPDSRLLLLDNPTRGLDIVSSRFIWDTLKDYVRTRRSTLIFSSPEIDEILDNADRVIVFFNGRVMLDVPRRDTDAGTIGKHLAGLT
jgi:simple sugar transport system ATP-binding protein